MELDALVYYAFRLAGVIAPHVPPALAYRAATWAGSIAYRLSPLRGNVEDNVAHITGMPVDSPRVRAIACQVYRNQCKNYYDLFRLPALSKKGIMETVRGIAGLEHLDRALSKGRGVVLVSGHYGNFDLAAQNLAIRGYRMTAVAEHLKPDRLFRYVCQVRASHGIRLIPVDVSLRPIFRALRANEIVGLALDRNVTDAGREVQFIGQPARLPDGYLKLALHTGAALVAAFCHRLPDNSFLIEVEPEVELERSGNAELDIEVNMPRVLDIFEAYLSRQPEQWVLFQRVWLPAQTIAPAHEPGAIARTHSSEIPPSTAGATPQETAR